MPLTFTEFDSGVATPPGNYDPGSLAFDGTNFWQSMSNLLVKYAADGTFVASYDISTAGYSSNGFSPIVSFGGFLWVTGKGASNAVLAKVTVTAGVPAITSIFDIGGVNAGAGVCTDGTSLYTIATGVGTVVVTKLNTAGAQQWQTTHAVTFGNTNIVFDGASHVWYGLDGTIYKVNPGDGSVAASNSSVAGAKYFWIDYSSFNNVIWIQDLGNQAVYQVVVATVAIAHTISVLAHPLYFSLSADQSNGNIWILEYDGLGRNTYLEVFDPTGTTQLDFYTFPDPAPGTSDQNAPEFFLSSGGRMWGGIVKSSDLTYALIGSGSTTPLTVSCDSPPPAQVGVDYLHTLGASGGSGPYTFSIISGALPKGLALNASTGVITGIAVKLYNTPTFTVRVTDNTATTATTQCSIDVIGTVPEQAAGAYTSCNPCEVRDMRTVMNSGIQGLGGMGYVTASGDEFIDIDQSLVFNYALPSGATINTLSQPISADGDFILCGWQMTSLLKQSPVSISLQGNAAMRIADDSGYRLMNDYINVAFMSPQAGNSYPYTVQPTHLFKAGTRISIDLQELSNLSDPDTGEGITNLVQIVFRGRYRYRVSTLIAQQELLRNANRIKRGI